MKKKNFSLILDDEFIKYCELNDLDIEKYAKELFNKAFMDVKYSKYFKKDIIEKEVPVNNKVIEEKKVIKTDKSNLYDE